VNSLRGDEVEDNLRRAHPQAAEEQRALDSAATRESAEEWAERTEGEHDGVQVGELLLGEAELLFERARVHGEAIRDSRGDGGIHAADESATAEGRAGEGAIGDPVHALRIRWRLSGLRGARAAV